MLPGHSGHRVVVLDLLAADLVPGRALGVVVEGVEAVEVTDDAGLASRVEGGAGELLDAVVLRVVEVMEAVTRALVEGNDAVIARGEDMLAPGERVGDG